MSYPSRWLVLAALLAGAPGCALYIEPGEGDGNGAMPVPGDGNGGPGNPAPTDPADPSAPVPLPPLARSGFQMIDTADGGNADGEHWCESAYSHYEHSDGADTQLHVVSIYEAVGPGELTGQSDHVEVRVTRPGRSVLLLSSFESAGWDVYLGPDSYVERIILVGYHQQYVSAPEGTKIESYVIDESGTDQLGYAYDWPSYSSFDLVDRAQTLAGLELTSYRGCYYGAAFEIDTPVEIRSPHVVSDKVEPTLPRGCEGLAGEYRTCISMSAGKTFAISLHNGTLCESNVLGIAGGAGIASLGWQGDYAYGCLADRGLARLSLIDGSMDIAPIACEAVTIHGDDLLVMSGGSFGLEAYPAYSMLRFDDFAAAARREVADRIDIAPMASRMAVDGDRGYFARHLTGTVETAELSDGALLETIRLQGYDDWINGLVAVGGMVVVLGPSSNPGLHVFDAFTGEALGVMVPEYSGDGLTCVTNEL